MGGSQGEEWVAGLCNSVSSKPNHNKRKHGSLSTEMYPGVDSHQQFLGEGAHAGPGIVAGTDVPTP